MIPSSFSLPDPSHSGNGSNDAQLQRMRTDIKNVIPLDIYECMTHASMIFSDLSTSNAPLPRHVKDFHTTFWKLYHLTQKIVSPALKKKIDTWFARMTQPKALQNLQLVQDGVALWLEFYDILTEFGMVTLFEGSIQPSFVSGFDFDLDDLTSDLHVQHGRDEEDDQC